MRADAIEEGLVRALRMEPTLVVFVGGGAVDVCAAAGAGAVEVVVEAVVVDAAEEGVAAADGALGLSLSLSRSQALISFL